MPANADDTESGVLLAEISQDGNTFVPGTGTNGLNFGVSSHNGSFTLTTMPKDGSSWSGVALAAGTIGYGRLYNVELITGQSNTAIRLDGDVLVTSGAAFLVSTAATKTGVNVTVSQMNINLANQ
jgi:hypothetical protein